MNSVRLLGMDVGSVSVSAVLISKKREIIQTWYRFHQGDVRGVCRTILEESREMGAGDIAVTHSTPSYIQADHRCDNQMALIYGVRHLHGPAGTILVIGGERFGALFFDENGRYRNYRTNTSCAAGTGSFLDQQARRLKLASASELGGMADRNQGTTPKIATRCAVFAKTDLVHAQQEGYDLSQICDGLCRGLARNVIDTLFVKEKPLAPLVFTGGVSLNPAVVRHLEDCLGLRIQVYHQSIHGALGAGLDLMNALEEKGSTSRAVRDSIPAPSRQPYFYDRLELKQSDYPDFSRDKGYCFPSPDPDLTDVEATIYRDLEPGSRHSAWLGLDIGSTSTKGILIDLEGAPLAGFYTRTAGRPIRAMQNVLAALDDYFRKGDLSVDIRDAAVTGAGRKLVGKVIGAGSILDEITAHARAAWEIEPGVDTIIEIGGQDSKFTLVNNRSVTFSVMNTVCAAGTGSFIEELAERLGVPLADYADRAGRARSPLVSDRCTVFMERDINHFLREGYSTDELLAAVLHSICENYLTKVAVEGRIGRKVLFQGATAKNKALAAAFEKRLDRPIVVSKYCHLTGAWGAALMLADRQASFSAFRGIELYRNPIPVRTEVCELCTNHCKITVAEVAGETAAYGFLCGRDYEDKQRVSANRSGFDLLKQRKAVFRFPSETPESAPVIVGLPAALYMVEDLPFWEKFFDRLGFRTLTSEQATDAAVEGKRIADAEFCSPMAALHGHVAWLAERVDFIFLPIYLERKAEDKTSRRQYCYYSQYAPPLASIIDPKVEARLISPLVYYLYSGFHTRMQIYRALKQQMGGQITWFKVSEAFQSAQQYFQEAKKRIKTLFSDRAGLGEVNVVFLGRPYTVLQPAMNKGVPNIFARFGVKTFFQDMLEIDPVDDEAMKPLLEEVHWHYSAEILAATRHVARTRGLYPVLITSFKCSPDSFIISYFKKLMEAHKKPYLILQLDEHDSNLGYETRIEAALRSFENHHRQKRGPTIVSYPPALQPRREKTLIGKTLFLPRWDDMTNDLMAANLRSEGLDVRVLRPSENSLRKGLRVNTGQCIPLNIMAQEFIDNVESEGLDPEKAVLWTVQSKLSCNLALFPFHIKTILDDHQKGFEKSGVYTGYLSFIDISVKLPLNTYFAIMFAGMIRKIGCRIRPYEVQTGRTERTIAQAKRIMIETFEGRRSKSDAVREVVSLFQKIETAGRRRPKVAVFGDLYVRDNEVMNQRLYHFIEKTGGEVITTPYHYYIKMIAAAYLRKWFIEKNYKEVVSSEALLVTVKQMEKTYLQIFDRILEEPEPKYNAPVKKILAEYGLRIEHTGESMENLLKIHYLMQHHPDLALFVQASPAFCCPSLVTEAMNRTIERKTGVPVVSITYDGTGASHNDAVTPYLMFARERNTGDFPTIREILR